MAQSVPRALRTLGAPRWVVRCWVLVPMTLACRARPCGRRVRRPHEGCALPVAIVCGSGNQGHYCALPVMEYAEYLRCDHERLVRAVMLSDLIAVHIKSYIGALGVLRCYLRCVRRRRCDYLAVRWHARTDWRERSRIRLATWAASCAAAPRRACAAKISAAVDAAILGHDMAMQGRGFRAGEGLIQDTVERDNRQHGLRGPCGV